MGRMSILERRDRERQWQLCTWTSVTAESIFVLFLFSCLLLYPQSLLPVDANEYRAQATAAIDQG